MVASLKKLSQQFIDEWADMEPATAISWGLAGHEDRLADYSSARVSRHLRFLKDLQSQVNKNSKAKEGSLDWLDHELLSREIKLRQYHWGPEGRWTKNPTLYVGELIYPLWYLFLRRPSKTKLLKGALSQLRGAPSLLEAAKNNLKAVPKLWIKIAQQELQGYQQFLPEVRRELCRLFPKERSAIFKAVAHADALAQRFHRWLPKLKKDGVENFAIGEKNYNFLLKTYHAYPINADALVRLGKNHLDRILEELADQARRLHPKKSWVQLFNEIKNSHPAKAKLLGTYQGEVKRLKAFLKRKQLVSIPKSERLKVIETPVFSRSTIPYAAYVDPPMFSGANVGTFFVTPPSGKNAKALKEYLKEHNHASLRVTSLHEGYPGHHLQFAVQKNHPRLLPRVYQCSSFYEGWALYCEEMMYENDYYEPETRLVQLRDQLWRACRVLIDVGLQTKTLSHAQAVKFLSRQTQMDKAAAAVDVNWYSMSPTVPQSYLTGMLMIKKLRNKIKKQEGKGFTLKSFHDRLIKNGAIPIPLVEKMM